MKILLLGDYSNVHASLARALRLRGHEVCVASDGDGWKNYPRDIDLARPWPILPPREGEGLAGRAFRCAKNRVGQALYLLRLLRAERRMRGFDVVQLINPLFLPLKPKRVLRMLDRIRRKNGRVVLCAMGMDAIYIKACFRRGVYRYSDFFLGDEPRDYAFGRQLLAEWRDGDKGWLCRETLQRADCVVAGAWEYHTAMRQEGVERLYYVPLPIDVQQADADLARTAGFAALDFPQKPADGEGKLKIFIGVQKARNEYKGTDLMLRAAERLVREKPDRVALLRAENVPFDEYVQMYRDCDVLLDQLYAYSPGMNALEAMARGIIVVSGGEEEHYALIGEKRLRPIVNTAPTEQSVYEALVKLAALSPEQLAELKRQSREYVLRHHDYRKVAARYEGIYRSIL